MPKTRVTESRDEKAAAIKYAEAFEVCEYGAQPDKKELKRLFPFFE